jgi:hypothetical protein
MFNENIAIEVVNIKARIKQLSEFFLKKLFVRKNIVYALLLIVFILFVGPIKIFFDEKVVEKFLSQANASVLTDVILYLVLILTGLYFFILYRNKRIISNELFLWIIFITTLYLIGRFGNSYIFLNFDHTGLSFLYYADWIIIYFLGIVSLKIINIFSKPVEATYDDSPFFYDVPIADITKDLFGRRMFAEQLATKIKSRKPERGSIAIGINGPWGSGKTSFLNMILGYLQKADRIIIKFEPWKCKSTKEIIKTFFEVLVEKIEAENKQLSFSLQEYADKLVELDENIYTKAAKSISSIFTNSKIKEELYDEINAEISNIKKQIIIVIDDLDRLDKKEIIEVIRLIRNTADFNGVTFLACYDKGYILNAIKELNEYNAAHYLEKIFQYEFVLPVFDFDILNQQLIGLAKQSLDEVQVKEFGRVLYRTIDPGLDIKPLFLKTQRDVIRLANGFFFELKSLEGEVDMEDLFCLHLLKLKYQKVYELLIEQKNIFFLQKIYPGGDNAIALRENSDIGKSFRNSFEQSPTRSNGEKIEYVFQDYLKENKDSLQLLEADLDVIETFITTIFDEESRYRRNLRSTNEIVYAQSFDKYFAYNILKNSISTKEFDNARTELDKYLTYLKLKVDLKQSGPIMSKMFLVKEFKDKDEVLTHFKGLCYFGNLVRREPIFDIYHDNYRNHALEIFNNVNLPDDVIAQANVVKKELILNPEILVPFFEFEYCRRFSADFKPDDFKIIGNNFLKQFEYAIKNKKTPAYPPFFLDAAEFVKKIKNNYPIDDSLNQLIFSSSIYDFWNFNSPEDLGVFIKQQVLADQLLFSLDTDCPLMQFFNETNIQKLPETVKQWIENLKMGRKDFAESVFVKELTDFLGKLKPSPSGINYIFKNLKPGRMPADHSDFKWEFDPKAVYYFSS